MAKSELIDRLLALRSAIRRRLLAYGACAVLAGGVGAFLTIVTLDWLLELPPMLRVLVGWLFFSGFVGAAWYWTVRPLQVRLGLDEVAARLEAHFGSLQDRLTSTVDFLERGGTGSASMMRRVIANTEQIVSGIPLESALSLKPLLTRGALLAVSVAALGTILLVSPGWARTGLYRHLYPWGEIEWPRAVSILPLTGNRIAAVGESVTVRMRIQRGLHDTLRGVVHLRERDGGTLTLAMQRERDDTFYAMIDAVTRDLEYWFEAGDDSTVRRSYTIEVVKRPEVVEALIGVEPPPYAFDHSVRVRDLRDGPVRAPIGGHARVMLRTSKPIPPDLTGTKVGLRTKTGEFVPLIVDPQDDRGLSARFPIKGDVHFRIELRDEHGFENRGAAEHSILATPDTPPSVTVLEPKAVVELTPKGSVPLLIRVEDDFGLTRLDLEIEHIEGGATPAVSLTDRLERTRGDHGVAAIASYMWSVEGLSLSPGDVLIYSAVATDNHATQEAAGQVGRSTPLRIKIISEVEFDIRLRSDIALLEKRIRQAALDEADLLDRTTALLQHTDTPTTLTNAQGDVAAMLAARQARLVRRLRDFGTRFRRLAERMVWNHAGDEEARIRIASLGDSLQRTAADMMTTAGTTLDRARDRVEAGEQQRHLREAVRYQEAVIDHLHALLRSMSQWGSFHELVTRTRDLLDRQNTVRTETGRLGGSMLGKPLGSLTDTEAATLKRTARLQEQIATDVGQHITRMRRLEESTGDKDPSGAGAIDTALRAARAHDLTRHLRFAADAIKENRTAAATIDQKAAIDALRKMVTALRERDSRELEELRKRLEQAGEQVALLIEQQQALRDATHEADLIGADEESFGSFEQRQRTLKRNTRLLGAELADAERTAPAARLVRQAATPMGRAEERLRNQEAGAAAVAQDEALALLNDARQRLDELARETAEEELRRSLAQIGEDLEEILTAQRDVNAGIGDVKNAIEARGRISRKEARAASKLAREQAGIRAMVEAQVPDFEKVPVYEWALQRVGKWMDTSRSRLDAREIDAELVAVTDRIVNELQKLVNAIVETGLLPFDEEFIEAARGGGSEQGGMAQYKPVPTVAELFVLKAMQVDINERTGRLGESFDLDTATEEQLRKLRIVGEDQAEVRRLTEMVTDRIRHP